MTFSTAWRQQTCENKSGRRKRQQMKAIKLLFNTSFRSSEDADLKVSVLHGDYKIQDGSCSSFQIVRCDGSSTGVIIQVFGKDFQRGIFL